MTMNHNNSQGNGAGWCKACHQSGTNYLGNMEKKSLTHEKIDRRHRLLAIGLPPAARQQGLDLQELGLNAATPTAPARAGAFV